MIKIYVNHMSWPILFIHGKMQKLTNSWYPREKLRYWEKRVKTCGIYLRALNQKLLLLQKYNPINLGAWLMVIILFFLNIVFSSSKILFSAKFYFWWYWDCCFVHNFVKYTMLSRKFVDIFDYRSFYVLKPHSSGQCLQIFKGSHRLSRSSLSISKQTLLLSPRGRNCLDNDH